MNKREITITADGSRTLFHREVGEHYHSRHGAVGESRHVFIGMGLEHFLDQRNDVRRTFPTALPEEANAQRVSVLEIGFGTGLNFLISAAYCQDKGVELDYCGIEAFPLEVEVLRSLDYQQYTTPEIWSAFLDQYPVALAYERAHPVQINPACHLTLVSRRVLEADLGSRRFDVVYFDAFAAIHQPDMWTSAVFEKVTDWMAEGGVFVTYAITGQLKRIMRELGLQIQKLPGAPGKREMLRAVKERT